MGRRMARQVNRLSARAVATATKPGRHADGGGLYLVVDPSGAKRWAFLFRRDGKLREMGLGGLTSVPLARARELAGECRAEVAAGRNPIEARKANRAVPTFGAAADAYVKSKSPEWRNAKHAAQWTMTLTKYAAPLRSKPVNEIGTDDVLEVLRPIWRTKPETASRLRGRIEHVLDAARAAGHRTGENPARWRGHLDKLLPKRQRLSRGHHAALPYPEVPAFVVELRKREAVAALALEYTTLTAARSGETLGARWPEIDLDAKVWTVPPERMKAGREHRVPLSGRALEILKQLAEVRTSEFVFPGQKRGRPLSVMALEMVLRRMKLENVTVHGFRSSFRDWAGECTSFPREIAEAALAHTVGDQTERAYRRGDALEKRRKLMDAWASFLAAPKAAGTVVPIKAERRA